MSLSKQELQRYHRHLVLKGFGIDAQVRLQKARVLVVGAGGLGCPALLYLAAAGVGTVGIIDDGVVSLTNLQRQILYSEKDVGRSKVECASHHLLSLNSELKIQPLKMRITSANALNILRDFDLVIDGSDNFPTRYLLNDACVLLDKPLVYGSILEFEGHVSVFNTKHESSFSANYRDLFPEPPPPQAVPDCSQAGVLGVLPGIIGSLQALEAIKVITGIGEPLSNKLLIFDGLTAEQTVITIANRNARDGIKTLVDYEDFCGISQWKKESLNTNQGIMKEVTAQELQELKSSGTDFQLIDVREPYEYDICNLEGELIPMSEIPNNVDKISREKQVVIHCRSGKRSGDMLLWLEKNHGFTNLYNLKGGILAWARDVDPEMPTY